MYDEQPIGSAIGIAVTAVGTRTADVTDAACVICGGASAAPSLDGFPTDWILLRPAAEERTPPLTLCATHWSDYTTDWLLIGWCVDHYGQALQRCPVHDREIELL